MKAISLWQPWASLWCSPRKIHETRHWPTTIVGRIAVHAAKRLIVNVDPDLRDVLISEYGANWAKQLARGAIIGTVDIIDCLPTTEVYESFWFEGDASAPDDYWCGDFSPGRFAWKRGEFRALKTPIPYIGRQGIFNVPDEIILEAA